MTSLLLSETLILFHANIYLTTFRMFLVRYGYGHGLRLKPGQELNALVIFIL